MEEVVNNGKEIFVQSIGSDGVVRECPECGSKNIVTDCEHAEIYCGDCNVVIQEKIVDLGSEWSAFDSDQYNQRTRTGPPKNYYFGSGETYMPLRKIEEIGIHNLRIQGIVQSSTEKSFDYALGEIERIASALKLSKDIRKETKELYHKAMEEKLIRGRGIDKVIPALLYYVCKYEVLRTTFKEIAKVSKVTEKEIRRTYFSLLRNKKSGLKINLIFPCRYVPKFCLELGLSGEIQLKAIKIIEEVIEKGLISGLQSKTIASVAIVIAIELCNEHRTKEKIAKVCGVTTATLRNNREKLEKALSVEIPNKKNKKTIGRN